MDPNNGLSKNGKEQVEKSAQKWILEHRNLLIDKAVIIYSSIFSRALETAQIVKQCIDAVLVAECKSAVRIEEAKELVERDFGELEGKSNQHYQDVWKHDPIDQNHRNFCAESINQVVERAFKVIRECESKQSNQVIFIVSHGDVLQILQAVFSKKNPGTHRMLPHMETAEIRQVHLQ